VSDADFTSPRADTAPSPAMSSLNGGGDSQPVPLRGCLYCHAEGTTTLGEIRRRFGLGAPTPTLTCSSCGAVADFEIGNGSPDSWRIRYRSVNKAARFYYAMVHLGRGSWLDAETALHESLIGFVQRHRLQQTQHGDLLWLRPAPLAPAPPLMSPDEIVYVTLNPASLKQNSRGARSPAGRPSGRTDDTVQDSGRLYLTDHKLHLLGHRRDWSHKLTDIARVEYTDQHWRVYLGGGQYYQGENLPNQLDAQLFCAVVKALGKIGDGD
jgi:hypothetical protein